MKVLFFGAGAFGLPTLGALHRAHQIVGVVSQPDRPAGRGRKLTPSPIAGWAREQNLPVHKPESVNDPGTTAELRGVEADAWVVIAFGQRLGAPLLQDRFAVNLHASLLPRWRGAAPIHHAILAGDQETGNSVITLANRMDAGLVLGQSRRQIEPEQTTGELHDALAADGPALVLEVLDKHAHGVTVPVTQDETLVTRAGKLSKRDGYLDFTLHAKALRRRVHGLTPWPGTTAELVTGETTKTIKPLRVRIETDNPPADTVAGDIIDAANGLVVCGSGSVLRIVKGQIAGKKPMAWDELARGAGVKDGDVLRQIQPKETAQ